MSKRKGMSASEKRVCLLKMFHETKDVFTLQEVEKRGAKCGIVRGAVLDTNQALVDDGAVDTEKIGSAGYYWSFPSRQAQRVAIHAASLSKSIMDEQASIERQKKEVDEAASSREESDYRNERLQVFHSLKKEINDLEIQFESMKENDPAEVARRESEVEACKSAANRWTDNILELRSWLVKKKGMSSKEAKDALKQMGVSVDLDYVG